MSEPAHGAQPERHNRPGWWPASEPWPPTSDFAWRKVRRRFFVRFATGALLVSLLVMLGPLILIGLLLLMAGLPSPGSGIAALIISLILLGALPLIARGARRFASSFGALIEAAGRVETGDLAARVAVPDHGTQEMRWLAEAFNSMAGRLDADERQRRSMLADISHELRTPLAILRGDLEAMIDGIHPIDAAHLAAAVDQIAILTKLIEDLRTLALAEAGTLALHRESVDLAALAGEVAASFESLADVGGVRIVVHISEELPALELDPLRIREVLGNLLANALRYAPPDSVVSITMERQPASVRIAIADHGPGIAPEVLARLFERFAKSDASRGSGLGLAIVRRLVETHGGSIAAMGTDGGGTTIVFELPIGELANNADPR
jgi:two-component system sensor histidine kinase BaeS